MTGETGASQGGVYLDYNAAAPLRAAARAAMLSALEAGGNASSVHAAGRAARARIEAARVEVAALAAVRPDQVVFTSGGAEANALGLASAVAWGVARVIVSAVEHDTVAAAAETLGLPLEILPVDGEGVVDLAWLERALACEPRALVALMAANNETGVIQPVAEAAALVRAAGGWLHVDAVQAAGKFRLDLAELGAHSLSLSAHKLGGPAGVGALIAAADAPISRQLHGGGQERGLRAGTENLAGIAGFGAAAREAWSPSPDQSAWRDAAAARIEALGGVVIGKGAPRRLDQTLCVAMPRWPSELQVIALDLAGIRVSAGAACSSGKVRASRVLQAMGRDDLAAFALRVSGGWATTPSDWAAFAETFESLLTARARRAAVQPA